jgi:hypothetical protein
VQTLVQQSAGVAVIPDVGGMTGLPTATREYVPRKGGHDHSEEECTQGKEGLDHV